MSMLNFAQEIEQAGFAPIAANSPATTETKALGVIEEFVVECLAAGGTALTVAQMKAALGYYELTVGGDTKRRLTVTDMLTLEKYFGRTNVNGMLVIPTYRMDVESDSDQWLGMWGTAARPSIQHKFDVVSVAALATMKHRVRLYPQPDSGANARVIGSHNKIITREIPVPASGILTIQDLISIVMPADTVERIHIVDPSGDGVFGMTKFMSGSNNLLAEARPERLQKISYDCGRVPQAGMLSIELNTKNSMLRASLMKNLRDLSLVHTFTTVPTANKVRVIFETMNGLTSSNPEDKIVNA